MSLKDAFNEVGARWPKPPAADIADFLEGALNGEEKLVREYIATYGPNIINAMDASGGTVLSAFAIQGKVRMVDWLLKEGATLKDSNALHGAVLGKKPRMIAHLMKRGANPEETVKRLDKDKSQEGMTPYLLAVAFGCIEEMKMLDAFQVNVMATDAKGRDAQAIADVALEDNDDMDDSDVQKIRVDLKAIVMEQQTRAIKRASVNVNTAGLGGNMISIKKRRGASGKMGGQE